MPPAAMSVVVLADRYPAIRRLVDQLRAQSVAPKLELVVGCPFKSSVEVPIDVRRALAGITIVETPLLPLGTARAAAVHAATAPVVAFADTHAVIGADWAERLLVAHSAGWAAVAPGLRNANPEGAFSWAGFLMDYGECMAARNGNAAAPPTAICSWKRDALLATGERLPELLAPGALVEGDCAPKDARFRHEAEAQVGVLNAARAGPWASERYLRGRLFAARRSRQWSIPGRLLHALGFFVVPLLRLIRTQRAARAARRERPLPRMTLPAVVVGSTLWALGEAMGYLAGAGRAEARILEYELHKDRFAWRKL